MSKSEDMRNLQERVLDFYGRKTIPEQGSRDHVVQACLGLKNLVDAEVRHVTLSAEGLARTLARVFVECLCALSDEKMSRDDVCHYLVQEVFEPRNIKYGNSYQDFGAVGVVIRLLDHARAIEHGTFDVAQSMCHIANYAIMAFELLVEADSEFLP